jgi:hypothetical protein
MTNLQLAKAVLTKEEAGLDSSNPLTREPFDAYYERASDTVYLNLSSEWPEDFVDWDAYLSHYVVPLLVHEHLHGVLYTLDIDRGHHHWAITELEDVDSAD